MLATTTRARFSRTDSLPEVSKVGIHYDETTYSFVNALPLQYAAAPPPPPWASGDDDEDKTRAVGTSAAARKPFRLRRAASASRRASDQRP